MDFACTAPAAGRAPHSGSEAPSVFYYKYFFFKNQYILTLFGARLGALRFTAPFHNLHISSSLLSKAALPCPAAGPVCLSKTGHKLLPMKDTLLTTKPRTFLSGFSAIAMAPLLRRAVDRKVSCKPLQRTRRRHFLKDGPNSPCPSTSRVHKSALPQTKFWFAQKCTQSWLSRRQKNISASQ